MCKGIVHSSLRESKIATRYLMIQGTASHVGKSVIVAALCRIFSNHGVRVAPFKAQNMALNSTVTLDGLEIGRSTAVQALAARTELRIEMNPILIKPKAQNLAQMMLLGHPYGDFLATDQFDGKSLLKTVKTKVIHDCLRLLSSEFDLIIIEGAGSPAEINLRQSDVVNMDVAEWVQAPVILVADIDRGGAIAAVVGTYALLSEKEQGLLCGLIFNKFCGDKTLLDPALRFLKEEIHCPTLGVIPYYSKLRLMEEDTLPSRRVSTSNYQIDIVVIEHRHLSNFTDLDPLAVEPGVLIRYIQSPETLGHPDAIILPGTKNTVDDLRVHYASGLASEVLKRAGEGTPVIGICGGYQMMGKMLVDPSRLESENGDLGGLGLLDVETRFRPGKITQPVDLIASGHGPFLSDTRQVLTGYEIHSGETKPHHGKVRKAFSRICFRDKGEEGEGAVSNDGMVFGSTVHGLFENDLFRRRFIDVLRQRKGLPFLSVPVLAYRSILDQDLNQWANWVEGNMDLDQLCNIIQI